MTENSLQELPSNIIRQIIGYLPAQDKVNLLYTNYHFYVLVQPLLYKNLYFSKAYQLSCPESFDEALYTMIGVAKTPLATDELNRQIYQTRQEILLSSMHVNPELCKFVENIVVEGTYYNFDKIEPFEDVIDEQLLDFIKSNCTNLKSLISLRSTIPNIVLPSLEYIQLSSLENFEKVVGMNVKGLELALTDNSMKLDIDLDQLLAFAKNLKELTFDNELSQSIFLKTLIPLLEKGNDSLRLHSLRIIFHHYYEDPSPLLVTLFEVLDVTILDKLEIEMGCDDITCDCLHTFTQHLIEKGLNVTQLSLIQITGRRDHNYTEAFDFLVTSFLRKNPKAENIKHLFIKHMPPDDFNVDFGFEGNYLHRKELYKTMLPLLKGLETFSSPTFLQSVACYEQLISNLLWNGCKCSHCDDYLPIFDKFILQHQYYDEVKSHMTDMISPILFGNVAKVLGNRRSGSIKEYPALCRFWNFHDSPYDIIHFLEACPYDNSAFPPITTCVIHFLQNYVDDIGTMIPSLKRCTLSGVTFHKDNIEQSWTSSEDKR